MKKDSDRLSKKENKKQLIDSLVYNENINTADLNKREDRVKDYEDGMNIIKEYEDIIKTNKRNIMFSTYQEGKVFRKFKENRKFKSLVGQFNITKGTIIFGINVVKLVDEYPKMMTSSITLNIVKSYYEDVKSICKENQEVFK